MCGVFPCRGGVASGNRSVNACPVCLFVCTINSDKMKLFFLPLLPRTVKTIYFKPICFLSFASSLSTANSFHLSPFRRAEAALVVVVVVAVLPLLLPLLLLVFGLL